MICCSSLIILLLYMTSYFVLSRRGYAEARRMDLDGFYYVTPENSQRWELLNGFCRVIYWPLNTIDCYTGYGWSPAADPLWDIE